MTDIEGEDKDSTEQVHMSFLCLISIEMSDLGIKYWFKALCTV